MVDRTLDRETVAPPPGTYSPEHGQLETEPAEGWIGRPGEAIRAITFSGGAFDTALQLGVIHALLVCQGRAPDLVVGSSAGCVHAVALAEVFQAGEDDESTTVPASAPESPEVWAAAYRRRLEARVRRFRQILDGMLDAPGKILHDARPDTTQVEAQRPLEPLRLPIHELNEWPGRHTTVRARAGLLNLYNQLLQLRVSIGTLTRAVRRALGIQATFEIRSPYTRIFALMSEISRSWLMLGTNLVHAAPLLLPLGRPLVKQHTPPERGATAADLIFRSYIWNRIGRAAAFATSFVLLGIVWVSVSVFALILPSLLTFMVVVALAAVASMNAPDWAAWERWTAPSFYVGALLAASLFGYLGRKNALAIRVLWTDAVCFVFLIGLGTVVLGAGWSLVLALGEVRSIGEVTWQLLASKRDKALWLVESTFRVTVAIGVIAVVALIALRRHRGYIRNVLAQFDLADGLFSTHPLRQIFVDLFDRRYYGNLQMDDVVERALRDDVSPRRPASAGKPIAHYAAQTRKPPIFVGLTVADVKTGQLEFLPPYVRVVDGLLASTAKTPLFPPQPIDGKLYIDGSNVANEPTRPLLDLLRVRANPASTVVQLYSVVPFPFSRDSLPSAQKQYGTLVDVTTRALELQRFRDATLGRRLTELFTTVIPKDSKVRYRANGKTYLRTWVNAIEPEEPPALNEVVMSATDPVKRRKLIATAVADGCRASLEMMISRAVHERDPEERDPVETWTPCRRAVRRHLAANSPLRDRTPNAAPLLIDLPGSSSTSGPGLAEVCGCCVLKKDQEGKPEFDQLVSLRRRRWKTRGPAWPHEEARTPETRSDAHFTRPLEERERGAQSGVVVSDRVSEWGSLDTRPIPRWPLPRLLRDGEQDLVAGNERPLISLLFSGGVFRGVHQMGVLNALSELDLEPDIIAGASVGSITAAMVAHAFMAKTRFERRARVAELASTYLSLDRLILTDRFADSVRNFTLRAASTRFSLREADRIFRRYDHPTFLRFGAEARLVIAGIERLLYVSPFELTKLIKALRDRDMRRATRLIRLYLDEWLDRMGVGLEILGAEPLALLITEHVLKPLMPELSASASASPSSVPFDAFLERGGIYFLATVTNLTRGKLEILGAKAANVDDPIGAHAHVSLLEGLLASSAFPGVFRPRWAREVTPMTAEEDQYIDGGVMDNLPLDAVAQFLLQAANKDVIAARPKHGPHPIPHLLFAASLEPNSPYLTRRMLESLRDDWPALWRRARTLGYNKKLDAYASVQRGLRTIHEHRVAFGQKRAGPAKLLDLEVVTVRPNWLCGTFAFHPMLGFRRKRQAESIAHGCASTLLELGQRRTTQTGRQWLEGWRILERDLPPEEHVKSEHPFRRHPDAKGSDCWFRPGSPCPFSTTALAEIKVKPQTAIELAEIHAACGRLKTHLPRKEA